MKIIKQQSYKKVPWKNGKGFTFEIAVHRDLDWRISSAIVDRDSDFSLYPEHNRTLIILDGELKLIKGTNEKHLQRLEPFHFSGETPLRCELVNGTVHDLNIFARKEKIKSQVEVIEIKPNENYLWRPLALESFAFIASGSSDKPLLNAGDTLQAAPRSHVEFHSSSGAMLVLINLFTCTPE